MASKQKRNIDSRLSALRNDFQSLQTDAGNLANDVVDAGSRRAVKTAQSLAERAFVLAEEAISHANHAMSHMGDEMAERAGEVRDVARENPLTTLLLTLGVGALFGAIFLRRT